MAQNVIPEPYRSAALTSSNTQIRLLDVAGLQNPRDENEPLCGLLRVVDLNQCPKFAALSYVWGKMVEPSPVISCGRYKINTTPNCFSAIWHLRKKLGAFTIWVDAVCIDQSNMAEKTLQMPLMKDIFTSAETVYIWLGLGTEQVHRAMTTLPHLGLLGYFFDSENMAVIPQPKPRFWAVCLEIYLAHQSATGNEYFCFTKNLRALVVSTKCYMELLDNDWLHRIWTYQEVVIGSNPVIVYGTQHVTWDSFVFSAFFLCWAKGHERELTEKALAWQRLAVSRATLRAKDKSSIRADIRTDDAEVLMQYQSFLLSISRIYGQVDPITDWGMFLAIPGGALLVILTLVVFHRSHKTYLKWLIGALDISLGGLYILLCAVGLGLPKVRVPEALQEFATEMHSTAADGLVDALRTRVASDGKDYNFGVRGLLQSLQPKPLPALTQCCSVQDAHTDLAIHVLGIASNAYPLLAGASCQTPSKPSWVVNWSQKLHPSWDGFLVGATARHRKACASQRSGLSWKLDLATAPSMLVRGYEIGVIVAIHELIRTEVEFQVSARDAHLHNLQIVYDRLNIPGWWTSHDRAAKDRREDKKQGHELILLPHIEQAETRKEVQNYIDVVYNAHRDVPRLLDDLQNGTDRNRAVITQIEQYPMTEIRSFHYEPCLAKHVSICNNIVSADNRIFSMTLNDSMGIASSAIRPGDRVMLLAGVPIPVIMRYVPAGADSLTSTDSFSASRHDIPSMRLVSPAGVVGMMQGQQWDGGNGQALPLIRIV